MRSGSGFGSGSNKSGINSHKIVKNQNEMTNFRETNNAAFNTKKARFCRYALLLF
jgi:hypothetical protein